ncbi:hypothetical protein [Metasolibacillus fluoroglycofenilyticus]|uniref:hypothetical protein n=1 Tax=Metasolibacillus fluoroglycofenilyticus TaxID=1239396 RepID=UPI000D39DF2D|nr:hypothetical protein [Metasolibacillus fluoroglycofenilyticus]
MTVKQDGSIEYKKLSTDTIDVSAIFTVSSVTAVTINSQSIIGKAGASIVRGSIDNNEITLTPVNVGTATVIISDGTRSIQAQVTVINDNGLKVTHSIPVSNYYTSTVGFYPTAIKQPNGSIFTSTRGIVTVKDGEITVYPGEISTTELIVEGSNGLIGLFELNVRADDYKFAYLTQTISYDQFTSSISVLATAGNAKAQPDMTGLDVSFEDLNESFLVVKVMNQYKVVKVQA